MSAEMLPVLRFALFSDVTQHSSRAAHLETSKQEAESWRGLGFHFSFHPLQALRNWVHGPVKLRSLLHKAEGSMEVDSLLSVTQGTLAIWDPEGFQVTAGTFHPGADL